MLVLMRGVQQRSALRVMLGVLGRGVELHTPDTGRGQVAGRRGAG